MSLRKFYSAIASVACFVMSSVAFASDTGNQTYTVTVPQTLSIVAPTATSITHDETDNNQAFSAQAWEVTANAASGVTVTFNTPTAFVHTTNSDYKRDARLALAVASSTGPGVWSVTTAIDETAYAASTPDNAASVVAASDDAGNAVLNLTVTFLTGDYGVFASGTYELTVTGTVVAN